MGPEVLDSQPFVPARHIPDRSQHKGLDGNIGEEGVEDRSPTTGRDGAVVSVDDGEMEVGLDDDFFVEVGFFVGLDVDGLDGVGLDGVGFLVGFTVVLNPPCAATDITDSSSSMINTTGEFIEIQQKGGLSKP